MGLTDSLNATLAPIWPHVHVELHEPWGAKQPAHREQIRAAMIQHAGRPTSVSHCPSLGGFACLLHGEGRIGLDVEETARLQVPIIARVSTAAELTECAGHEGDLWVAKEATWKALGSAQPETISAVLIHSWQAYGAMASATGDKTLGSIFIFRASVQTPAQLLEGSGLVVHTPNWRIGIFI